MTDVQVVGFGERHVAAFAAWFNALPHNELWNEPWVREKSLDCETYDPALMIAAEVDGEPVGFLLGSVANETGWIRAFIVREDRRRQGIGSLLFETIASRFRERGITEVNVGWALPRYFLPGIDVTYTDAIVFLDRHGYESDRVARVNMDVELTGRDFDTAADEARLREAGIITRRATPEDREGITALCLSQNHEGWAPETGMALEKSPVPVFVAVKDGTTVNEGAVRHNETGPATGGAVEDETTLEEGAVCGFATHSICGPVHFGPMLTHESLRGMGIGSVLLKACLRDWQEAGLERCEITWAGPLSFYARSVGATMGKAFWTFHTSL